MKIEGAHWLLAIAGALVLVGIGIWVGGTVERRCLERAAVKADVAEWVADDNGKAEFKWITDDG